MSGTPEGGGMKLPNLSTMRIVPGTENTPEQRHRTLVFTLQNATGRQDLIDLVEMLGLVPELVALRGSP